MLIKNLPECSFELEVWFFQCFFELVTGGILKCCEDFWRVGLTRRCLNTSMSQSLKDRLFCHTYSQFSCQRSNQITWLRFLTSHQHGLNFLHFLIHGFIAWKLWNFLEFSKYRGYRHGSWLKHCSLGTFAGFSNNP